jgi:DNA-directed RNA polymerase specialized sigma24 family protein
MSSQADEFAEYVAARRHALKWSAFLMCGDWHRAEDLVQSTFLKLHLSLVHRLVRAHREDPHQSQRPPSAVDGRGAHRRPTRARGSRARRRRPWPAAESPAQCAAPAACDPGAAVLGRRRACWAVPEEPSSASRPRGLTSLRGLLGAEVETEEGDP